MPTSELTPRAERILVEAQRIATDSGASRVGVEHIQLAILQDTDSVPYQILAKEINAQKLRSLLEEHLQTAGYLTPTNRARFLDSQDGIAD